MADNNNGVSWPADHEKGDQLAGTAGDLPSYRSQRSIHDSSSARKRNSLRRASLLDNQSEIIDIEGLTNDTDVVPPQWYISYTTEATLYVSNKLIFWELRN